MKTRLLPYYFKAIGLMLFIPTFLAGVTAGFMDGYNVKRYQLISEHTLHVLDIIGFIGLVIIALSKDKVYDELLQQLRLESIQLAFMVSVAVVMLVHIVFPEVDINPTYLVHLQVMLFIGTYYYKKEHITTAPAGQ